jgi:tetratricopeptide (TPR) repeat protein
MWKEFFGEEALGATEPGHYFSVLRLANGKHASLDSGVKVIENFEGWKQENFVQIGLREEMYQTGVLSWEAGKLKKRGRKYWPLVEKLFLEAIRLNPEDPGCKCNLAILLSEQPDRWMEAEKYYLEAIRLNPQYSDYKCNLAILLSEQPDRWAEAEKLFLEAYDLAKTNPWIVTGMASFYYQFFWMENLSQKEKTGIKKQFPDCREKALKFYREAEKLMQEDLEKPENQRRPNCLSLEEIQQIIEELLT